MSMTTPHVFNVKITLYTSYPEVWHEDIERIAREAFANLLVEEASDGLPSDTLEVTHEGHPVAA